MSPVKKKWTPTPRSAVMIERDNAYQAQSTMPSMNHSVKGWFPAIFPYNTETIQIKLL